MTKVFNATTEVQLAASDLATEILMDAIEEIAEEVGLSPLSAATALLQANCQILAMMGGRAARQYMQVMAESPFVSDRSELPKMDKKLRAGMERMAQHFDLMANRPMGSA